MSDPKPQLLLTRRPIICTRCMHGHAVDVITGREKTPTEYHCVFCGNYAIVGVPAKWPFMEVVKQKSTNIEISKNIKSDNNNGSSPMQLGESLAVKQKAEPRVRLSKPAQQPVKKAKEEKKMAQQVLKCSVDGCEKPRSASGICTDHFLERYGITDTIYREHRQFATEGPARVARRLKADLVQDTTANDVEKQETKAPEPEKREAKTWPGEDLPIAKGDEVIRIALDPDLLKKLAEKAKEAYRTPELHAAYLVSKGLEG